MAESGHLVFVNAAQRALGHAGGMDTKPFSPACERNSDPILAVLRRHFGDCGSVFEVGSGTGQHAVHFAAALPWLSWQCADLAPRLPGIRQWLDEAGLPNTPPPLALDVCGPWPEGRYDAVFSANILHIVGWPEVEAFFAGVGRVLGAVGMLAVYGPFNANGIYTSTSNRDFDASLKARGLSLQNDAAERRVAAPVDLCASRAPKPPYPQVHTGALGSTGALDDS